MCIRNGTFPRILKIELCSALQKGYILFVYLFLMILLNQLAKLPFVISLQAAQRAFSTSIRRRIDVEKALKNVRIFRRRKSVDISTSNQRRIDVDFAR